MIIEVIVGICKVMVGLSIFLGFTLAIHSIIIEIRTQNKRDAWKEKKL